MKRLLTICMILCCCLILGFTQGIRGSVTLTGKAAMVTSGHSVTLSWNASQGATSYCIYRGTTHGGPYVKIASGTIGKTYASGMLVESDNGNNYHSLVGAQGPQGATGPTGPQGPPGAVVPISPPGATGPLVRKEQSDQLVRKEGRVRRAQRER